jgi:hypothetical protein
MIKYLISAEILVYLALSVGMAFDFIPVSLYSSNEIIGKIAATVIIIVFCVCFLLSASASKNYFSFRTPFISFLILILCFSLNKFSNFLISGDLLVIVIFSLAFIFFASKGEAKLFFPSLISFCIAIFAFVFYKKNINPTNVFFVSFSSVSAIFAFVSSHFNNRMEIHKRESELKLRIASKIQNTKKRSIYDFT